MENISEPSTDDSISAGKTQEVMKAQEFIHSSH